LINLNYEDPPLGNDLLNEPHSGHA
jgi:hypothetical protein